MPKRGHQPRGLLVTDPGKFIVTLSASTAVQGATVTATAQFATTAGSPIAESGITATWGKLGVGGSFNNATSTTNIAGVATVRFTVGSAIGGTYKITAAGPGHVATGTSSTLTVTADTVPASITVTPSPVLLEVGETEQLTAVVKNALGTVLSVTPTWASLTPTLATVDSSGLVTAVAVGTASIQARANGINSNTVTVTVGVDTTAASIVISPATLTIASGTVQLAAVVKNAGGAVIPGVQPSAWQSSSPADVTVSSTGLLTYVSDGSANITATLGALTSNTSAVTSAAVVGGGGGSSVDATLPTLMTTTRASTPSAGATITVSGGGDFQAALNSATDGDKIVLALGATFTGNFTLPAKGGSSWITVQCAGTLPVEGTRMTAATAASMTLPKIKTANTNPAIQTADNAGHWRFIGIEVLPDVSVSSTIPSLVTLGGDSAIDSDHIFFDCCYVHGLSGTDCRRGLTFNGTYLALVDSEVSEIHSGYDAQAIAGWDGAGPFKIVNNKLEASGENIAFGGSDPTRTGLNPADIEIRRNYFYKPLAWVDGPWTIKNLLELKKGTRVLIRGNVFENCWVAGQAGYCFVLWSVNQQATDPTAECSHVTVLYNVTKNTAAWFNLSSTGSNGQAQYTAVPMHHLTVRHNVKIGPGSGRTFQIGEQINQFTINHNTAFGQYDAALLWGGARPLTEHIVKDNILGGGTYHLFCASLGITGAAAWSAEAGPGSVFLGNVDANSSDSVPTGNYTAPMANVGLAGGASKANDNSATLADLTLGAGTWFKNAATDGTDCGADMVTIAAEVAGVGGGF